MEVFFLLLFLLTLFLSALVVVLLTLLLPFLNYFPVYETSEAREGTVIQELLRGEQHILPLRNGQIIPSKPVLFHWLGALVSKVSGRVDQGTIRLPSTIFGIGLVLSVFFAYACLGQHTLAALSSLMLATTYGFVSLATDGRVDMVFTFFVSTALLIFFVSYAHNRSQYFTSSLNKPCALIAVLTGLAVLTKGPLGVLLVILPIAILVLSDFKLSSWRIFYRPEWLLLVLVTLPWYLCATYYGGMAFLERQLWFENILRIFGDKNITEKPVYFYLIHIWTQGAPWVELGLTALIVLVIKQKTTKTQSLLSSLPLTNEATRLFLKGVLIWIGTFLVFYSISSGKRRGYLVTILPPICIFLAPVLQAVAILCKEEVFTFLKKRTVVVFTFLIAAVAIGSSLALLTLSGLLFSPSTSLWLICNCCALGILMLYCLFLLHRTPTLSSLTTAIFSFFAIILYGIYPGAVSLKAHPRSSDTLVAKVKNALPKNAPLSIIQVQGEKPYDVFMFYWQERVNLVPANLPLKDDGHYLVQESWLKKYKPDDKEAIAVLTESNQISGLNNNSYVIFQRSSYETIDKVRRASRKLIHFPKNGVEAISTTHSKQGAFAKNS